MRDCKQEPQLVTCTFLWNILLKILFIISCSSASITFLGKTCFRYSCSSFTKHSGWLYLNNLLRVSLRLSHPQSIPVASVNAFTTALMPVALVIFSTVSPKPLLLGFFVGFVAFFLLLFDFFSSIV